MGAQSLMRVTSHRWSSNLLYIRLVAWLTWKRWNSGLIYKFLKFTQCDILRKERESSWLNKSINQSINRSSVEKAIPDNQSINCKLASHGTYAWMLTVSLSFSTVPLLNFTVPIAESIFFRPGRCPESFRSSRFHKDIMWDGHCLIDWLIDWSTDRSVDWLIDGPIDWWKFKMLFFSLPGV